jgi:hypothetical protein
VRPRCPCRADTRTRFEHRATVDENAARANATINTNRTERIHLGPHTSTTHDPGHHKENAGNGTQNNNERTVPPLVILQRRH